MARAKQRPDTNEIATTRDGRDITRPWVGELRQPRDPRLLASVDWGVYERIRKDDQVKACYGQRVGAVVSREWTVIPGDEDDPRSVECAEAFEKNIQRLGWDRVTEKMLWAPFYGYAVAELVWAQIDGLWQWSAIKVRHARRFRFDREGRLRLLTPRNMMGELLPERKFWVVATGATDDDEPYGEGLADWLYWPTLFKRNGIRFWNLFLDKFGQPTAKGTYKRGTPKEDIQKLLAALQSIATDSGFVVPEGVAVELLEATRSGSTSYKDLCDYMDGAIAKVILGQTMTTDDGASLSQAKVHAGVKLEIVRADADLNTDSFNNGPACWWTDYNYGPDVAAPILLRQVDEEEDLKATAETDLLLDRLGYKRTEESFNDIYGDGYEPKPAQINPPRNGEGDQPQAGGGAAEGGNGTVVPISRKAAEASFAEPLPSPSGEGPGVGDVVDHATARLMADDAWHKALDPIILPLIEELAAAADEKEVEAILARAARRDDTAPFVDQLTRAGFAMRLAGETGTDGAGE